MSTKSLTCKIFKQRRYPSGLGRFIWQVFIGKGYHTLMIAIRYRPCKSVNVAGSAYMQHLTRFNQISIYICPRQDITDKLSKETVKWKEDGDQIIIMGDINAYMESKDVEYLFD